MVRLTLKILALGFALVIATPVYADCGIGQAVDDFNAQADHSLDDWGHVIKIVFNELNDPHPDLDYDPCTIKEIKKGDGFLSDYIDYAKHHQNNSTNDAIAYAKSVQKRMHDAIARKEAGQ
jgi:hypothetical protein